MTGYPTVRTDDILVHPRDGDLIVASHGRSLWIVDDITPLQQFAPAVAAADATLFDVRTTVAYANDVRLDVYTGGEKQFEGENVARGTAIHFYLKSAMSGDAKISIADATGRSVCESTVKATAGMHRVQWVLVTPMLAVSGAPGAPGAPGGAPPGGGAFARSAGVGAIPPGGAPPSATAAPTVSTPAPQAQPTQPPDNNCSGATAAPGGGGGGGRGGGAASATPGSYVVKLSVGGKEYVKSVQVLEDRWMNER